MPTFGAVGMVAACLSSIRAQRDVRVEIVVSDDTGGDSVRDWVGAALQGGEPYRYLRGPRTGNPVDNWNHGLDQAAGPIRLLVHQDETLLRPDYLRDAVDVMADPGVAAAIARTRVASGTRSSRHGAVSALGRRLPRAPWFLPSINWIGPTAAFVFRAPHRFDRGLVQLVDVEFYMRVLATGRSVVLPGERVGSRGYHPDQITARIDPVALALVELDALRARRPPSIGSFAHAAARLATRARRWSR